MSASRAGEFWKAATDFRSAPTSAVRVKATVTLLEMAFGPKGSIQKRATDFLGKQNIKVLQKVRPNNEQTA